MAAISKIHKAIAVIQFKLEGQAIARNPGFWMEDRRLLDKIDYRSDNRHDWASVVSPSTTADFPTIDPADPYALTERGGRS